MTPNDPTGRPTPVLVLLLKSPRAFPAPVVRAAAARAFAVPFASESGARRCVVPVAKTTGLSARYAIRFNEYLLGVAGGGEPYWSDPTFGAELPGDPRAKAAIAAHHGWVAVDSLGLTSSPPMVVPSDRKPDVYRMMSRLALEFFNLVDEDCTALVVPESRRVYPNGDGFAGDPLDRDAPPIGSIRDLLSTREPAALLGILGAAMLNDDDPRVQAAMEEARRRMPEFLKAWEGRANGGQAGGPDERQFLVKATFADKHGGEQMWVAVTSIESGVASGLLQSEPSFVKYVRQGQKVKLKLEEVVDFLYHDGRSMAGAFTDRVIRDIMEGRR